MCKYNGLTIAAWFIKKSYNVGKTINALQLNKLVYLSNAYNLALFDESLIYDNIEAWKYGPIISKLYTRYKDSHMEPLDYIVYPVNKEKIDKNTKKLLEGVYKKYGNLSGQQLSNICNHKDTPWALFEKYNKEIIPNTLIRTYYKNVITK